VDDKDILVALVVVEESVPQLRHDVHDDDEEEVHRIDDHDHDDEDVEVENDVHDGLDDDHVSQHHSQS